MNHDERPKWCANRSSYLRYKEKYNWTESEPSYFSNDRSITINYLHITEDFWYKSWGEGSMTNPYHRADGPARMWYNGKKEYWLNGIIFKDIKTDDEWLIKQIIE